MTNTNPISKAIAFAKIVNREADMISMVRMELYIRQEELDINKEEDQVKFKLKFGGSMD